jgi:hypothetical protein
MEMSKGKDPTVFDASITSTIITTYRQILFLPLKEASRWFIVIIQY